MSGLHARRPVRRHRPRHSASSLPADKPQAISPAAQPPADEDSTIAHPAIAGWAPPPKPGPDLEPPLSLSALAVLNEIDDRLQEHLRIFGRTP